MDNFIPIFIINIIEGIWLKQKAKEYCKLKYKNAFNLFMKNILVNYSLKYLFLKYLFLFLKL
jgi:hypothetical protein